MKKCSVAILGATGAVGREMLKVLEQTEFPIGELRLLAGGRSAGSTLEYKGEKIPVTEAADESFRGMDIVLGAADNGTAERFAPAINRAGAVFVDNSSAFRLREDVPLVIPEINGGDALHHNGIVANPNCSTIITLMAIAPIAKISPIKILNASTYQAASGAGADGLRELTEQARAYADGRQTECGVFPQQLLFNVIPKIGSMCENGFTTEEMKLQNEGRKILHLPEMKVCCTCVRVPVLRCHSISAQITTQDKVSVEQARAAIAAAQGVELADEPESEIYPTPLMASDRDTVFVGRVRRSLIDENGLALWCCGDQLRKGAATNAVQIARLLV